MTSSTGRVGSLFRFPTPFEMRVLPSPLVAHGPWCSKTTKQDSHFLFFVLQTHVSPQEGVPSFFLFPYIHFLSRHRYVHTLTQERKQFTLYSEELISFLFHSRMRWWTRMTTCHDSAIATTPPHYLSPHRGTPDIVAESEVTVLLTSTPNMLVGWGQVLSFQLCPHSLSLRACMRVCGGGGGGGWDALLSSARGVAAFQHVFPTCSGKCRQQVTLLRRTIRSPGHALMKALWCWQTLSPRGGTSLD